MQLRLKDYFFFVMIKRVIDLNKAEARQNKIIELLIEETQAEVAQLAIKLQVSQVTVRKDLDQLEEKGLIHREHGFATLNSSDDISTRLAYHYEMKRQIAKMAGKDIQNGETVMIESGSCCCLLAEEIVKSRKNVTIITNSAFIAEYIRNLPGARIILLGGNYQNESQVMVGPLLKECAKQFYVDRFFFGTDGFSRETGFTGNDDLRCEAVRSMAAQARRRIIVTESEKFRMTGVIKLMDTSEINEVYTDEQIDPAAEAYLSECGVMIKKAG